MHWLPHLWKSALFHWFYRNDPKFSDTQNICCNYYKVWTMWLYHRLMSPNDADWMANSVDPDQTAPLGAVWSGSALFAQACLSENLGSLRYSSMISTHTFSWSQDAHIMLPFARKQMCTFNWLFLFRFDWWNYLPWVLVSSSYIPCLTFN